jgi:hypothetical protein
MNDVAAVAQVELNVYRRAIGWYELGGTSAASPLVAGMYARAGRAGSAGPDFSYSHTSQFSDVTTGSNGSCGGSILCTAGAGYDAPTGNGTPNVAVLAGYPDISAVSPRAGSNLGNVPITVTGQNFTSGMRIQFDGIDATQVSCTPTTCSALTPYSPGSPANRDVHITAFNEANGKRSLPSPRDLFTVLAEASPLGPTNCTATRLLCEKDVGVACDAPSGDASLWLQQWNGTGWADVSAGVVVSGSQVSLVAHSMVPTGPGPDSIHVCAINGGGVACGDAMSIELHDAMCCPPAGGCVKPRPYWNFATCKCERAPQQ